MAAGLQQYLGNSQIQSASHPGTQGLDPLSLFQWRLSLSRVLTGTGPAYWLCAGASASAGVGSGTDSGTYGIAGCALRNYNYRTALKLNSFMQSQQGTTNQLVRYALTADSNALIFSSYGYPGGSGTFTTAFAGADPRVAVTGASGLATQFAFGGNAVVLATNGTLTYTPIGFNGAATYTNAFVVVYERLTGSGAVSFQVNGATTGVSPTTQTTAGTNSLQKVTVTCTRATGNVFNITATTGPVRILAVIDQDTTIPAVHVLNGGVSGSVLANWEAVANSSAISNPYNFISYMAPNLLTMADFPVNDCVASGNIFPAGPPAQVVTDFLALIALGQVSGSTMFLSPYLCNPSANPTGIGVSQTIQAAYSQAFAAATLSATAVSQNGVPTVIASVQIPYSTTNGFLFTDGEHPTYIGHDTIGIGQSLALQALS